MKPHVITDDSPWWHGLICLYGELNVHWEYIETDPVWWQVRFIGLNLQN